MYAFCACMLKTTAFVLVLFSSTFTFANPQTISAGTPVYRFETWQHATAGKKTLAPHNSNFDWNQTKNWRLVNRYLESNRPKNAPSRMKSIYATPKSGVSSWLNLLGDRKLVELEPAHTLKVYDGNIATAMLWKASKALRTADQGAKTQLLSELKTLAQAYWQGKFVTELPVNLREGQKKAAPEVLFDKSVKVKRISSGSAYDAYHGGFLTGR